MTYFPGDRVMLDNDPAILGTVIDHATPSKATRSQPGAGYSTCELVIRDGRTEPQWWNRGRTRLIPAPKEPPVTIKHDTRVRITDPDDSYYGRFGTVTAASSTPGVFGVRIDATNVLRRYALEDLEEVFTLTRDELETLERARRMSAPGDLGLDILAKHLHPKVTRTFTVTIEQPARRNAVAPEDVALALQTGASIHSDNAVTVKEATR